MSKNLTRKGLALGTALAFVVTGLTATAPAYAAAGDVVSIAPTTGTGYGAYNTDGFSVTYKADTDVLTSTSLPKISFEIASPNQDSVVVNVHTSRASNTSFTSGNFSYYLVDDNGNVSDSDGSTAGNQPYAVTAAAATTVLAADSDAGALSKRIAAARTAASTASTTDAVIEFTGDYKKAVVVAINATTAATDNITINANDGATATTLKNVAIGVTAWVDSDSDALLESTDKYPSKTETVTFYDSANVSLTPRVERLSTVADLRLNAANDTALGASVSFSPAINLDQLNQAKLVFTDGASGSKTFTASPLTGNTTQSPAGRLTGSLDFSLTKGAVVKFDVTANAVTTTKAVSAGFTVPSQSTTDGTTGITAVAGVEVNKADDSAQTDAVTPAMAIRPGVKDFTYTMTSTAPTGAIKSNVPVVAVVTATNLATDGSLTVGATKITEGQVALVSGVTDEDGKFAVTVTSALAKTGETYTVDFRTLLFEGTYASSTTAGTTIYTATYTAVAATTFKASSEILAGATVAAKFTLVDNFGKAISANAAGTAYVVELKGNDTTKLKKYATFANGEATVSFTNYLAKGQSDSLTATLGTGVDTAWVGLTTPIVISAQPVLYNPEDAAGINTVSSATKEITYDAFITGAANSATNIAPSTNDDFQLTGTVVDTTGAGIPGAVVTVSGKGLQFVKSANSGATRSGDYAKDSITITADSAGSYEVSVWAHQVSSTGIKITTTSGGKSVVTTLKTTGNGATTVGGDSITADDLVFTWTSPAHPAVDATYIVTGKVSDKWGNGLAGASVVVDADGALEVNGTTQVTRTTNAAGTFRVYFKSLPKTSGVANLTATLKSVAVNGTTLDNTTGNDEFAAATTFKNVLTSDVTVGKDAVAVAGSKAGTAKVTAYNAKGSTVTVYVAGKKVATKKATSGSYSVTVKAAAGAVVKVVVGSTTYFNSSVN